MALVCARPLVTRMEEPKRDAGGSERRNRGDVRSAFHKYVLYHNEPPLFGAFPPTSGRGACQKLKMLRTERLDLDG